MNDDENTEEEQIGIPKDMRVQRRPYTMTPAAEEARKANAQLSTGPKSEEGKARSSRNAFKHGLYAASFITGFLGRPCRSSCDKFENCSLVSDGAVIPGDDCLDKQFVAEAFDNVIRAIQGKEDKDQEDFQALAALEIAGGIDILRMLKESIIENGVLMKDKKIDAKGATIGEGFKLNPAIQAYNKMLVDLGFTPSDFNMTPSAIAKASSGKKVGEAVETLASIMGTAKNRQMET